MDRTQKPSSFPAPSPPLLTTQRNRTIPLLHGCLLTSRKSDVQVRMTESRRLAYSTITGSGRIIYPVRENSGTGHPFYLLLRLLAKGASVSAVTGPHSGYRAGPGQPSSFQVRPFCLSRPLNVALDQLAFDPVADSLTSLAQFILEAAHSARSNMVTEDEFFNRAFNEDVRFDTTEDYEPGIAFAIAEIVNAGMWPWRRT